MKKILIILFSILLLTGCNNKTLTCNKLEESAEIYSINSEHVFKFKKNKVNNFTTSINVKLIDDSIVKIEDFKDILKEKEKEFSDEGFNTKIKTKDNESSLIISSEKNPKNLVNKFFFTEDYSYEYIKKYLKKEGYSCK